MLILTRSKGISQNYLLICCTISLECLKADIKLFTTPFAFTKDQAQNQNQPSRQIISSSNNGVTTRSINLR